MAVMVNDNDVRIERLTLGSWDTNTYIVVCQKTNESLVVDAPAKASEIIAGLQGTNPRYILLTHDHSDHTGALVSLRSRLKVSLAAHEADSSTLKTPPEISLKDGDTISLGNLKVRAMHVPGHTPGSLCFKVGKYLLAGDTIFPGGPGKTWSPDEFRQLLKSITEKMFLLPDDTVIYPGHGDGTTVKKAKEEYTVFSSRPHSPDLCGDVTWLSG
jgi:glyoxylase-like metal-dependent hydrolase (beta-lactamase superfamily II)